MQTTTSRLNGPTTTKLPTEPIRTQDEECDRDDVLHRSQVNGTRLQPIRMP